MFNKLIIILTLVLPVISNADFCDFVQLNKNEFIGLYGCETEPKATSLSISVFCEQLSQKDSLLQTICDLGFLRGQVVAIEKKYDISPSTLAAYGLKHELKNLCQKDVERILRIFFTEEEAQFILESQSFESVEPYLNRKINENDTSSVVRLLEQKTNPNQRWLVDLIKNEVDHFWWKGLHYGHYCK